MAMDTAIAIGLVGTIFTYAVLAIKLKDEVLSLIFLFLTMLGSSFSFLAYSMMAQDNIASLAGSLGAFFQGSMYLFAFIIMYIVIKFLAGFLTEFIGRFKKR